MRQLSRKISRRHRLIGLNIRLMSVNIEEQIH